MLSLGVWRADHFIWRWSAIDGGTNCSQFAQDRLVSTTDVLDHGNLVLANWDSWPPKFEVVPHFYVAYPANWAKLKENFCYGCALLRLFAHILSYFVNEWIFLKTLPFLSMDQRLWILTLLQWFIPCWYMNTSLQAVCDLFIEMNDVQVSLGIYSRKYRAV